MAPEAVLDPHFTRTTWLECFASFVFDTLHFAFCWPWRELSPWWYAAFSDTYPFKCQKMSGNCFSPLSSASRPAFKVLQIAPLLCPRSCSYHPHAVEWPKAKTSISVYYIYILYNIYIYTVRLWHFWGCAWMPPTWSSSAPAWNHQWVMESHEGPVIETDRTWEETQRNDKKKR